MKNICLVMRSGFFLEHSIILPLPKSNQVKSIRHRFRILKILPNKISYFYLLVKVHIQTNSAWILTQVLEISFT